MNSGVADDESRVGLRDANLDEAFGGVSLSDAAITAAKRVSKRFHSSFPGFELYRLVAAGIESPRVNSWAIMSARVLASAKKKNGRSYVDEKTRSKPGWVDRAGLDALAFVVNPTAWAASLNERSKEFGVTRDTYKSIRDPIYTGMQVGFRLFQTQLHAEYVLVLLEESQQP